MVVELRPHVGVRELRQNLSIYLQRVKEGATFDVTEHGQVVARLTPLPDEQSILDRMIAEGSAIAAEGSIDDILTLRPKVDRETARKLMRELRRQGEERL